jgi:hypothetical protein
MATEREVKKDDNKLKESIKYLLEAGCDVCYERVRVYRSSTGEYTLLVFDISSNLKRDQEESFTDINDAVSKFISKCKGKL